MQRQREPAPPPGGLAGLPAHGVMATSAARGKRCTGNENNKCIQRRFVFLLSSRRDCSWSSVEKKKSKKEKEHRKTQTHTYTHGNENNQV